MIMKDLEKKKYVIEGIIMHVNDIEMKQEENGTSVSLWQKFSLNLYQTGSILDDFTIYDTLLLRNAPQAGDKVRIIFELALNKFTHKLEYKIIGFKSLD